MDSGARLSTLSLIRSHKDKDEEDEDHEDEHDDDDDDDVVPHFNSLFFSISSSFGQIPRLVKLSFSQKCLEFKEKVQAYSLPPQVV